MTKRIAFPLALLIFLLGMGIYALVAKKADLKTTNQIWFSTTIDGEIGCLPHKNTGGPITLECAIGLKAENGKFYALKNTQQDNVGQFVTGKSIRVIGRLLPPNESIYDIAGIIEVETYEQTK